MSRVDGPALKIEGQILGETEKAIKFVCNGHFDNEDKPLMAWYPLSQVKSIHRTFSVINNTYDSLIISQWIARQKGIES